MPIAQPEGYGIPFTVQQFYGVFRDYNTAVWLAQWLLVAMASLWR